MRSVRLSFRLAEKLDILIEHVAQNSRGLNIEAQAGGDCDLGLRLSWDEPACSKAEIDEPAQDAVRANDVNNCRGDSLGFFGQLARLGRNLTNGIGQENLRTLGTGHSSPPEFARQLGTNAMATENGGMQ
jgi:hypothetical protein